MGLCVASNDHKAIFKQWNAHGRLEERTCRPVVNGYRVAPDGRVVTLAFFHEAVSQTEPVGRFVYFDMNPRNRSAECGYVVSPEHRGKGLGTMMLTQALDHLFATTDLNKLYCQTAAFNVASVKLLEGIGFQKDGTLREHHELDGVFWDDGVYSMLKRDWMEPRPSQSRCYRIRPYCSADETQWTRCRVLAFLDSAYFDDVKQAKPSYKNPAIELVAVAPDDTIIGFLDIECETELGTVCSDRPGLGGMIWDLGVHPDHRCHGVAKALLDEAVAIAQQHSLVRLEAWTRDDPNVVAWYHRQGFQTVHHYLHMYLNRAESEPILAASYPGVKPVATFAHCTQPEHFDRVRQQFQRVHDCQLFELRLD